MGVDTKKRNQILRRVKNIPSNKLSELEDFLSKLEQAPSSKDWILSFAGAWKEIDEDVFDELTDRLPMKKEPYLKFGKINQHIK